MRKRFYVSGYNRTDWECYPEWAEGPEQALAQAKSKTNFRGKGWNPTEVDPVWDAAIFNGETVLRWNLPPVFPC
jgi:hypothetical protein